MTITGTGSYCSARRQVNFGTLAATTVVIDSDTEITAPSPAETAGTVDVTVVTPGGDSAVSAADQVQLRGAASPREFTASDGMAGEGFGVLGFDQWQHDGGRERLGPTALRGRPMSLPSPARPGSRPPSSPLPTARRTHRSAPRSRSAAM